MSASYVTGSNGIAAFGALDATTWTVRVTADDYAPAEPVEVSLSALDAPWIDVALHAIPRVEAPAYVVDSMCIPVAWDAERFDGQCASFEAQAFSSCNSLPCFLAARC